MKILKRYLSNDRNKKKKKKKPSRAIRHLAKALSQHPVASNNHKAATPTKAQKPTRGNRASSPIYRSKKLCNNQLQVTIVKQQRVLQIGNSEDFAYEPRPLPWDSTEINTQSHRREWKRAAPED